MRQQQTPTKSASAPPSEADAVADDTRAEPLAEGDDAAAPPPSEADAMAADTRRAARAQRLEAAAAAPGPFFSIPAFSRRHPTWSEAALRWLRFEATGDDPLGLGAAGAFVNVGRKVLVHEPRFLETLTRGTGRKAAGSRRAVPAARRAAEA